MYFFNVILGLNTGQSDITQGVVRWPKLTDLLRSYRMTELAENTGNLVLYERHSESQTNIHLQ